MRRITALLLALLLLLSLAGCGKKPKPAELPLVPAESTSQGSAEAPAQGGESDPDAGETPSAPEENGTYDSKDDVALYLHCYGRLPSNYITKKEARALGWEGGSVECYAPGKCIGGDRFGNYEGLLPEQGGRTYRECDIDTLGRDSRGAKRIIYSDDGLIYYTEDHYKSFTLLYGEVGS